MSRLNSQCLHKEMSMTNRFIQGLRYPMVYQGLAFVKMTRLGDFGHDCTSKAIELVDGVP